MLAIRPSRKPLPFANCVHAADSRHLPRYRALVIVRSAMHTCISLHLLRALALVIAIPFIACATSENTQKASESKPAFDTKVVEFTFEGKKLSGLLDTPKRGSARGLVVLVSGSGRTHVHPGRSNREMRTAFAEAGFSVYAYDKPGCGLSEGTFDYDQSVENSSRATPSLAKDPFIKKLRGEYTEKRFLSYQKWIRDNSPVFDPETKLMVFVPGFEEVLRSIHIPVLAIFGGGDSQVDWRATRALYQKTIVPPAVLMTRTLSRCGHTMQTCERCAYGDTRGKDIRRNGFGRGCPGFLEAMTTWLDRQATGAGRPDSRVQSGSHLDRPANRMH